MQSIQPDMCTQAPMRRRLLTSLMAGLSIVGTGLWPHSAVAANRQSATEARLLELVALPDARAVGQAVLPMLGHPSRQALVEGLGSRLSALAGQTDLGCCRFGDLQLAFEEAVRADFEAGRSVLVGGWVLARTEVEFCALAALGAGPGLHR
jgi:hypothetical protein